MVEHDEGHSRPSSARRFAAPSPCAVGVRLAACIVSVLGPACSPSPSALERENAALRVEVRRLQGRLESTETSKRGEASEGAAATVESVATVESAATDEVTLPAENLRQQIAELRAELAREQELRLEREREWLRYTTAFGALGGESLPEGIEFTPNVPADELPKPAPPPVIDEARVRRAEEVERSLRALLQVEGVRGIDLLEAGALEDGAIGPVVFRVLDARGRLAGALCASRLRLVGSRTARSLTLVLEEGYESRGGVRLDFEPEAPVASVVEGAVEGAAEGEREPFGVRRIELEDVDPMPWLTAVPELFGGVELAAPRDDGLWNLTYVRASLNRLLRVDVERGYWRLKGLGGVVAGVLHDVHFEQFDAAGKLERRLFADRLRIERKERGVALVLEDGATLRGDEKTPFLDGRFRIYLPRAEHAEWNGAGLPGLTSAPSAAASGGASAGDEVQDGD
jgi:hypothetical protein